MIIIISLFIILSVVLIAWSAFPLFLKPIESWRQEKEAKVAQQMDQMFYDKSPKAIVRLYFILPILFGAAGYFILQSYIPVVIGIVLGLAIPNLILKIRLARRKQKFNDQLLDTITMLSSCLKGGLSLLQGFEVLVEEMPAPMNQELGLLLKENKMGVPFEESLVRLNKRMDIEELGLVVNALLVSRETGGELTKVFSRLTTTIRDNRKLKESIKTLTMQGRLQGAIMSLLPILFVIWVLSVDKHHFDIMLTSDIGRMLLVLAVVLQVVGMFLIRKFSIIKI
ncbi:MAG: type II secretion system F family protein [Candidatus Omnitrophota bacterium]|nr:type II secretion system F family protein [Candidatus Omnitrophota bacterium]